jgi:hypothetical protein
MHDLDARSYSGVHDRNILEPKVGKKGPQLVTRSTIDRTHSVSDLHLDEKLLILKATSPEAQWEGKGWTGVLGTRNGCMNYHTPCVATRLLSLCSSF